MGLESEQFAVFICISAYFSIIPPIKTANNRSIVLISNDNLRMKLAQFENVTDGSHGFCFKKEHKRPLKK